MFSCLSWESSLAQTEDSDSDQLITQQLWFDFYPHIRINDKWEYYGDAGYRTTVGEKKWQRLYIRPSVRYHFNRHLEARGGVGMFYTINEYDTNRSEIRPWQGLQLNWPNTEIISFKHFTRIEERISFGSIGGTTSFDLRLRYKLSTKIKLGHEGAWSKLYIPAYFELFFPVFDEIDELFRNSDRLGAGIGYKANKEWDFALMFHSQASRAGPNDVLDVSDHILQLKITKRWGFQ